MVMSENMILDIEIDKLNNYILNQYNIDISIFDKSYVKKMIQSNMNENSLLLFDEFISFLSVFDNFTKFHYSFLNGYSLFFREDLTYSILYSKILPLLISNLSNNEELRIWSVGCSKGQEPYSIAMLCEEIKQKFDLKFKYRIISTDVSKSSLEYARKGIYCKRDLSNIKLGFIDKFFNETKNSYEVIDSIKRNVHFSEYNVVTSKSKYPAESIYGNFDILMCSNLLIYYNEKVQQDIVEKLYSAVKLDGYFITSETEIEYVKKIINEVSDVFQSPILKKSTRRT